MPVLGHEARWDADTGTPLDLRPIGEILTDRATSTPHAPALRWPHSDGVRTWSYRQLLEESQAFARRLLSIAAPGEVAAIFAANSPDWVIFEYGCALAGVTFAPVNPNLTDPEVRHIVDASGAVVIFADAEFRGSQLVERARALGSSATVVELAAWRQLPQSSAPLPSNIDPASALLIQFTSGTTGRPKGAVISHRAAFNCARFQIERLGGTARDSWLNALPLHHVGGSVCVVLTTLACGGATVLAPGFDAGSVLRLIALARPTIIGLVPTMQMALLDHPDFASADVDSLRVVVAGGSVVSTALIERMEAELGAILVNAYGQSESPCAIMTSPDDDALMKAETIGRPLPHRDVRIERVDGSTASFGEIGQLVMRSPLTMDGYLGGAAAAAPRSDGWLHTGDLCSMDDRGVIRIHGRSRDVIIRGGENIYPAEVEAVILDHPSIADVAVVGLPDERWGEIPVACYIARPHAPVDETALEEHARSALASFKVPRRWVPMASFPTTAAGKVKKYLLQRQLTDGEGQEP